MKDNTIKQFLQENLKDIDNKEFNSEIIEKLNVKPKNKRSTLFNEQSVLFWFVFIAVFALFFYLSQLSQQDVNAIIISCITCTIPIMLLIFNKIYTLKNNIQ